MNESIPLFRRFNNLLRLSAVLLPIIICLFIVNRVFWPTGQWSSKIGGTLPNGDEFYFQSRSSWDEQDIRLIKTPIGKEQHIWEDMVHQSLGDIKIQYLDDGNKIWIESGDSICATIDLSANDFRGELDIQHSWAHIGNGTTLDERTSNVAGAFIYLCLLGGIVVYLLFPAKQRKDAG